MKMVKLADGLSFPAAELATQVVAALGMRGSGKSNAMTVIVEGLLIARIQVLVLDYVGIWVGLRLAPDGKKASGHEIAILGGRHGDIGLLPTAGALVARALAESGASAVLDVSAFTKGDRARFATDFAEALFIAKKQHPGPTFLVLEEAQRFIPQKLYSGQGQERMLGAFEEIAEVGRNYGLGLGLISQRPQKLAKDVLNLTELLLAFQTNGVLERKAIADWVQEKDAPGRKEVAEELPGLQRGQALVWSPSWQSVYGKYHLHKKTTYDAGATPLAARAQVATKPLKLPELEGAMAAVAQEVKANDPRELKAEVAKLRKELAQALGRPGKAGPAPTATTVIQVPAEMRQMVTALGARAARFVHQADRLLPVVRAMSEEGGELLESFAGLTALAKAKPAPGSANGKQSSSATPSVHWVANANARFQQKHEAPRGKSSDVAADVKDLSRAARALLVAIAQFGGEANDAQMSIASGYSVTSSSFANAKGELRTAGLVEYAGDARRLTEAGRAATAEVPPLPSGQELVDFWAGGTKLGKAERSFIQALWKAGKPLSKEQLSEATGYSITSSSFANALGALRGGRLIEGQHGGDIGLAEVFFR